MMGGCIFVLFKILKMKIAQLAIFQEPKQRKTVLIVRSKLSESFILNNNKNMMKIFFITFLLMFVYPTNKLASQTSDSSAITSPDTIKTDQKSEQEIIVMKPNKIKGSYRTDEEMSLTIYFLVFGAFVISIASILMYKFSHEPEITFKYFIITLLVIGMLLLIIIGLNQDQISPAVGLFGTIAGYLLGKTDAKKEKTP